jgi:hypothetical protein
MPLYAFLDESGEYSFHAKSSKFLVYAAVVTAMPTLFSHEFAELKYELLSRGLCLDRFHASCDKQFVRDRVFALLADSPHFAIHSIVVRKNRVNPILHKFGIYSIAYRTMLRYLAGGGKIDSLHLIVDTVPDTSQQAALKITLARRAAEALGKIPFSIDHHSSLAHALLQAADYCAWAIWKKWQSNEERPYRLIQNKIRNEFDLFEKGDTEYF